MFKAFSLLAAISWVRADFWIVQDYTHAPDGETYNPPSVALGPNNFNCDDYEDATWPSVSFTGLGPWWETMQVAPGLCGNGTGIDMYLDWDWSAGEPYWDVYAHGGDGQNLGSCWLTGSDKLTCGQEKTCAYAGGAATGACHLASKQYICYTALCGGES
jgi:hypothetical protein